MDIKKPCVAYELELSSSSAKKNQHKKWLLWHNEQAQSEGQPRICIADSKAHLSISPAEPSPASHLDRESGGSDRGGPGRCTQLVGFEELITRGGMVGPCSCSGLFGFLGHTSRKKNLACMKCEMKFICKIFSEICIIFRNESNNGN